MRVPFVLRNTMVTTWSALEYWKNKNYLANHPVRFTHAFYSLLQVIIKLFINASKKLRVKIKGRKEGIHGVSYTRSTSVFNSNPATGEY